MIINLRIIPVAFVALIIMLLLEGTAGCTGSQTSENFSTSEPTRSMSPQTIARIELSVSAAASTTDVLKSINGLYTQANNNVKIVADFASSGILQKQIEQGAPVDVFLSAGASQMDVLQKQQLILDETRKDLLNNKIVLIVPVNSSLGIGSFDDLISDKVTKVAMGDPKFVPAGTYGKETLDVLGITEKLQPKLILGADVRQVLTYVESGNVDAGIVYSTDAAISKGVKIVASAPDIINDKIVYPIAIIKYSKNIDIAKTYISFLFSNQAKDIFQKYGFGVSNKVDTAR